MRQQRFILTSVFAATLCAVILICSQQFAIGRDPVEIQAEQGNAEAQYKLGVMYGTGKGIPKDDDKAIEWITKSAVQGYAEAQFRLSIYYGGGNGNPKNEPDAFKWCQKAATQGHPNAQCNLGVMYEQGHGVEKDKEKAMEWYQKAALQGDDNAQYNVALDYAEHEDIVHTYAWFTLAATSGDRAKDARKVLEKMNRYITPQEKAEAQRLSAELAERMRRAK